MSGKAKAHEPANDGRGGWPGPTYVEGSRAAEKPAAKSKAKAKPSRPSTSTTDQPADTGGEG